MQRAARGAGAEAAAAGSRRLPWSPGQLIGLLRRGAGLARLGPQRPERRCTPRRLVAGRRPRLARRRPRRSKRPGSPGLRQAGSCDARRRRHAAHAQRPRRVRRPRCAAPRARCAARRRRIWVRIMFEIARGRQLARQCALAGSPATDALLRRGQRDASRPAPRRGAGHAASRRSSCSAAWRASSAGAELQRRRPPGRLRPAVARRQPRAAQPARRARRLGLARRKGRRRRTALARARPARAHIHRLARLHGVAAQRRRKLYRTQRVRHARGARGHHAGARRFLAAAAPAVVRRAARVPRQQGKPAGCCRCAQDADFSAGCETEPAIWRELCIRRWCAV